MTDREIMTDREVIDLIAKMRHTLATCLFKPERGGCHYCEQDTKVVTLLEELLERRGCVYRKAA